MSRILFASARGARIQRQHFKDHPNYWEAAGIVRLGDHDKIDSDYVWRIHPDDAHLQYGPVSTALREYAATNEWPYTLTAMLAEAAFWHEKPLHASEEPHASMFALILAESLADEGL